MVKSILDVLLYAKMYICCKRQVHGKVVVDADWYGNTHTWCSLSFMRA